MRTSENRTNPTFSAPAVGGIGATALTSAWSGPSVGELRAAFGSLFTLARLFGRPYSFGDGFAVFVFARRLIEQALDHERNRIEPDCKIREEHSQELIDIPPRLPVPLRTAPPTMRPTTIATSTDIQTRYAKPMK